MNPNIILATLIGVAIWLVTMALVGTYFVRRLQQQERLALIARGRILPTTPSKR